MGGCASLAAAPPDEPAPPRAVQPAPPRAVHDVGGGSAGSLATQLPLAWEPGEPIVRPGSARTAHHHYCSCDDDGGAVLRVSHSAISSQGRSPHPPPKPNQDSFVAAPALGGRPDVVLFAVFDGHGPRGEDAAHYSRVHLPLLAAASAGFAADPLAAVAGSFEPLHSAYVST